MEKPGDRPRDAVPDAVGARPPADDDLVRLARAPAELDDLVAVVPRGRGCDLSAAAVAHEQVEVDRQRRRGGRVARGGDSAVPRQRHLHGGEEHEPRDRHVVAEGRQPVGTDHARGDRPDVPAPPGAGRVAPPALLGDRDAGLGVDRSGAVVAVDAARHVLPPRAAADVAAGRGHQDRAAALGPGAQHPVDVLQQRRDARGGRRGEARARHGLGHWPRPRCRSRPARAARGRRASRPGCGRPSPPTSPRRCRRDCRARGS